jgi:hypothetical protein
MPETEAEDIAPSHAEEPQEQQETSEAAPSTFDERSFTEPKTSSAEVPESSYPPEAPAPPRRESESRSYSQPYEQPRSAHAPERHRDFRPASPSAVARAIEDVNGIVENLRNALEEMEEVLESLEAVERQKEADEHEIESLRRSLRQLHRPRDSHRH